MNKISFIFPSSGLKKDKNLKWYRNDTLLLNTELAKNESYRIKISSKGYLKFAEVRLKDAGHYKCTFRKDKKKKEWIIKGINLTFNGCFTEFGRHWQVF